jgi:hypothetical protein
MVLGHRHEVGVRDRVVSAEDDREGAGFEDVEHSPLDGGVALLEPGRHTLGIVIVDDAKLGEGIDPVSM